MIKGKGKAWTRRAKEKQGNQCEGKAGPGKAEQSNGYDWLCPEEHWRRKASQRSRKAEQGRRKEQWRKGIASRILAKQWYNNAVNQNQKRKEVL